MTYSCSNLPRPTKDTTYSGFNGYINKVIGDYVIALASLSSIPYSFSTECRYDKSAVDNKCCECKFKAEP